jgi:CspA family cold shock protein
MNTGTVKWFNATKGYGFVEPSNKSKDVFIHISALEQAGIRDLKEGQKISYDIESNKGKISAIDIKLI